MKKSKHLLLLLPAAMFALSVLLVPLAVYAQEDTGNTTNAQEGETTSEGSGAGSDGDKRNRRVNREEVKTLENQSKQRGQSLLQEAKNRRGTQSDEERQAACEKRKSGLQQKVENLVSNSGKYLDRVDGVFSKVQELKTDKNLNVDGYDELVAAATASQTTATASVDALKNLKPTIDCTSNMVPSDVATFKAAAQQARTDLKTYKQDVKAVLVAVKQALEAAETEDQ
ncbi:MAG TPA: hypothetical protein VFM05_09955 [Candidatus Saccharimonadales bacterium]|nr:hypothetical protein [Candidatus Saccharimonadales bacterium]